MRKVLVGYLKIQIFDFFFHFQLSRISVAYKTFYCPLQIYKHFVANFLTCVQNKIFQLLTKKNEIILQQNDMQL